MIPNRLQSTPNRLQSVPNNSPVSHLDGVVPQICHTAPSPGRQSPHLPRQVPEGSRHGVFEKPLHFDWFSIKNPGKTRKTWKKPGISYIFRKLSWPPVFSLLFWKFSESVAYLPHHTTSIMHATSPVVIQAVPTSIQTGSRGLQTRCV